MCGVVWHAEKSLYLNSNVSMCTSTTRTCVTTCGRGVGTHGDVLNLHTEISWTDIRRREEGERGRGEGGSPSVLLT